MKKVCLPIILLTLILASPAWADGIDLDECFLMAVRNSEALTMKEETIK